MDAREFRKEAEAGRASPSDVLDALERLERRVHTLERENHILKTRLEQYEPPPPANPQDTSPTDYSLSGEQKRRRPQRSKPERCGRRPNREKHDRVQRWVDVYPERAAPADCVLVRIRYAWRLSDANQAEFVGYRLYRRRGQRDLAQPDGLLPRGEYGIEIVATLAYLTTVMRLSQDRACELLDFFWGLPLQKSQANALLDQLAKHLPVPSTADRLGAGVRRAVRTHRVRPGRAYRRNLLAHRRRQYVAVGILIQVAQRVQIWGA